jgi:hypothetical protein
MHYVGTLQNGSEFDSSRKRGIHPHELIPMRLLPFLSGSIWRIRFVGVLRSRGLLLSGMGAGPHELVPWDGESELG